MVTITNKHPTQKLIGMDVGQEDKQMRKGIGRRKKKSDSWMTG